MALYQLRTTIDRSALSQDQVVWGLFGIDFAGSITSIIDDIRDAWVFQWDQNLPASAWPADHFFTSMEAYPAAGGPAAAFASIDPPLEMGTGDPMPAEVAVAVSEDVDTARGIRPVGRNYCGPLSDDWNGDRPSALLRGQLGDTWVAFHEDVVALGATPVVISKFLNGAPRGAPVGLEIVRYSIDDAWDTQRRRGWDATTRTTYTPA